MDAFMKALTGGENRIPLEFDWFAPLLGDGTWQVNSDVYARRRNIYS